MNNNKYPVNKKDDTGTMDTQESTVSLLLIESNQPEHKYYFPPNVEQGYRTKFEMLLVLLFKYIID